MLSVYLKQLVLLIKRLLVCYLFYFISRLIFYITNAGYFPETGFLSVLQICFYGLRFDSFSIVISNSLFILLSILPIKVFYHASYQKILLWLYGISNTLFLAFNYIDVAYFPFIKKRSTSELFEQMGGQSEIFKLIPQFAKDFWWTILLFIVSVYLLVWLYKKIEINRLAVDVKTSLKHWLVIFTLFILAVGFATLGARGGLQRVPIDVVNAGSVARPQEVPIVLNSSFTLIKSIGAAALEPLHYFTDKELLNIYSPHHHFKDSSFKKMNVVVLILESFSKEYTSLGRINSITPFLDSLMGHSMVFKNGFSNGTKSIEGIPAILSSLPSLMKNPVINSIYATNVQTSFASLLKQEGYTTAFFHGGINGTMNFNDWAQAAGYENYFGKDEYADDRDFDGFWGIFDEPFLKYSLQKMNSFKQPFHSAIFTLSSHHPYLIPDKYKNRFPKTKLENSESIGYADYCLKLFFEAAKKTSWYQNTLFVLTADHTSLSEHRFFANPVGYFTIPILFFKPDNSLKGSTEKVFSQIDILPSTMHLLGYNKPFFAFGQSYLSQQQNNACVHINGTHYLYEDSMAYNFIDDKLDLVYNYKRDSTLNINIRKRWPVADSLHLIKFKAFIQTYNTTLIENKGYYK